jgi:allantoinase
MSERDLIGYGPNPLHPHWPNDARIAVQFVLNYEEGGERTVLNGDAGSETFLSELFNPESYPNRHLSMESIYEYGSRVGVWRILKAFEDKGWPLTVFGVGLALERYPELAQAFVQKGHEVAAHGYRWIHYQTAEEDFEREHMRKCVEAITRVCGERPLGWYTGRDSPNTERLVADEGGFEYHSDHYGDDLPFYTKVTRSDGTSVPILVVPYTLDCNDMRFSLPQGYSHADPFFQYMKDSFDTLYAEGEDCPRMMNIGLHCRLIGRPGRFPALQKFLDYVASHDRVWVARRVDVARHWKAVHPFRGSL